MCDGKHSSRRDVVILSIKPKRPEYPINQKVVPVSELLQEWDKLDAYYRGQLLKLTKSLNKNKHKNSRHSITTTPTKVSHNNKHSKSSPVNKKQSTSSDQFTELFGDENLFSPTPDNNNNNNSRHNKSNKLLHSRSLNSLFDEDSDHFSPPPPPSRVRKNSQTGNLLVSIPVLTHPGDHFNKHHRRKYASDDDDDDESVTEDDSGEDEEPDNFLSVPRENYQVQYGIKQKTRVTLFETGNVSPRWIVPIHVAPYKPPTAQGLNGVQIQKILYHKNDTVNVSPTTTTARTPDKPPDNLNPGSAPTVKSVKVTESPVSTVSPRSTSGSTTATPSGDNNNATPKQTASQTPELSSSPSDQGINKKSATTTSSTTTANKLSSPPVNSTTGQKLKRPITEPSSASGYAANNVNVNGNLNGIKRRKLDNNYHTASGDNSNNSVHNFTPVTSTSSTYPGGSGGVVGEPAENNDHNGVRATGNRGEETTTSPKKFNKNFSFVKPSSQPSTFSSSSSAASGDSSVFIPPAAVSITDRIIKKASRPQPELIERQRRRRLESNQRKSYAMQKGDEHEERESIDLSMKSFEMIWNVPLLSPLRSP